MCIFLVSAVKSVEHCYCDQCIIGALVQTPVLYTSQPQVHTGGTDLL